MDFFDVCIMNSLYAQFENQDDDDNMTGNKDKLLIYEVNGDEEIVTEKIVCYGQPHRGLFAY